VFAEALVHSLRQLKAAQASGFVRDFALIGGFAVAAWGVPRATQDLDFAVAVGSADPRAAAEFLGGHYEQGDADDPLRGVIHLAAGAPHESVPLRSVLFPPGIADLIFHRVEAVPLMDRTVPVVAWSVLLILKLYAGGPQDRLDAEQLLKARQPQQAELETLRVMAESAGVLEEWDSLAQAYLRKS
jgi:hypothetical protein